MAADNVLLADANRPRSRHPPREAVAAFEHHYIGNLIKLSNGNASQAARVAGMDRPYLLALLRKHGLRGPGKPGAS